MDGYRFTQKARNVLATANVEAHNLGHPRVRTEHLLLGLLREGKSIARLVLDKHDLNLETLRARVLALAPPPRAIQSRRAKVPFSARAKRVLEQAMAEAAQLQHAYVGTEHLLLGLLRERRGIAARALEAQGLSLDVVRQDVRRLLGAADRHGRRPLPDVSTLQAVTLLLDLPNGHVVAHKFASAEEATDYLNRLLGGHRPPTGK